MSASSFSPTAGHFLESGRELDWLQDETELEEGETRFAPVISEKFFDDLDKAKIEAYGRLSVPGSGELRHSQGVRRGLGLEVPDGEGGLFDWRKGMPTDDDDSAVEEEEERKGDGGRSFEGDETPRPRDGFTRR